MLEEWQTFCKNSDTGRKIYNIMSSVGLRPTNWIREDVIFFSQHGPFSAYLEGVTSLTAIIAAVVELARHFTVPRSVPSQFIGIRAPNFELEWLKRGANNLVPKHKIKFVW
ncbi:hypothetical protein AVEN_248814-1 [Araneus ventricosus]|uniref:Uncharacterized protein n=1 Tax=Araneus ventricosus TaxID=182803 RepID=A0A4Y2J4E0_ARAVE|nr:hypothetical protein AVEN_248814-1 [Araneus ventricosus]